MARRTDAALLREAEALDRAHAEAAAFDAASDAKVPDASKQWAVYWDNGREACGTFPERYATEEDAEVAAERIYKENIAQDVWSEADGAGCEAIQVDAPPDENPADEMAELRKAALSLGQP